MEPNHHSINHKPPYLPESSYFRDHLRQSFNLPMAHMDPAYSGSTQLGGQIYPMVNAYRRQPVGMHEAIMRQIEKEKIREEIIAEEITRRRILEAEVRMELMIEREMSMRRELDGAVYTPCSQSIIVDPKGFPNLKLTQKTEVSSHGERIGMSALARHKVGSSETESRRGATLEFITPPDTVKEKEKIILPAKPEENTSSLKRKAEVWPPLNAKQKVEVLPSAGANELTSTRTSLKKKVKEESSCAICQVSTTSERALKEHLQGKKHKAKEAGLRKNGNNFSIGLCPNMISVPIELPEIPSSTCLEKGVNFDESMKPRLAIPAEANSENSETNNGLAVSRSPRLNQTLKQNESPSCSTGSRKRARVKKNFKFWCKMCQVGAFSETVMEAHRKGKKHIALLLKQNAVDEVKLVRCQKEAGEDGESTVQMDSEGNQDKFLKDTASKS